MQNPSFEWDVLKPALQFECWTILRKVAMEKMNLVEKFGKFSELWNPKIVGELNGQYVKLAKLKGEFTWHHHETEEELGEGR